MKKIIFFLFAVMLVLSCGENKQENATLDLMKYGLPIQIKAPAEAVVKANDMGFYKDVTVKKGEDYFIQILSTSITSTDINSLKNDQLREVKKNKYFKQVIFDEPAGFIFEKQIDSLINYDFRYIKIQGNNEFIFQTGLSGQFTEETVRNMYESVK